MATIQAADKTWHLVTDKGDAVELSQVSYLLAASGESFDIVCAGGSTISGVTSISIELRESTGIKPVATAETMFSQVVDGQLVISQAKAGAEAKVFTVSGVLLRSQVLTGGQNIVNISAFPTGTYILTVGETSVKFIKK